jgi:hypothetical protein
LPTAPAFAHKLHRLPPPSIEGELEPRGVEFYRGDNNSDAGGLHGGTWSSPRFKPENEYAKIDYTGAMSAGR